MNIDLSAILLSIGPSASIVFAAWIFMGFLQARYDATIDRYRDVIDKVRRNVDLTEDRRGNLKDMVLIYRHRCDLMSRANLLGLLAAMLLIATLIAGELHTIFHGAVFLEYLGAVTALVGFALIILAAGIVMREGQIARRQIDAELLDVEALAEGAGRHPGTLANNGRPRNTVVDRP